MSAIILSSSKFLNDDKTQKIELVKNIDLHYIEICKSVISRSRDINCKFYNLDIIYAACESPNDNIISIVSQEERIYLTPNVKPVIYVTMKNGPNNYCNGY
jgi:hypothetical protein